MTTTKRPRCTAGIAAAYLRKEGPLVQAENAMASGPGGQPTRRVLAWTLVDELLGGGSAMGLGCEPYLRDGAYRWLVACCRTPESMIAYARRMWRFCHDTGRRSLSAHTDTAPGAFSDWLFALEAAGLAPRTIVHHRDVLRSWFGWLFDRDLVRRSPITRDIQRAFRVDHASIRKADGTRQALTATEAQALVNWALTLAPPAVGLGVLLQTVGGLRSAEVAKLERRHLVEREGLTTLTVPGKGDRTRNIVCESVLVAAWRRYWQASGRQGDRGPLLRRPGGGHYRPRTIQAWAKAAAAAVGRCADISSHDLRKTAVTLLMEGGASLDQAQTYVGHSNPATTARCYVVRRRRMAATTGLTAPEPQEASA